MTERARIGPFAGVILPAIFAAAIAFGLGGFFRSFLQDAQPVHLTLSAAWAAFVGGRIMAHLDRPKGWGRPIGAVGAGAALGLVGMAALNAFFVDGPGWPMTPWWAVLAGVGAGFSRSAHHLMRRVRAEGSPAQLIGGFFDPREGFALSVLIVGYVLLGFSAHFLFDAFSGIVPNADKFRALGIAAFALYGARLILQFAAHERAGETSGFLAWFKANLLRNALVVIVLVAYAVYRDDLATTIPFFPLIEFGLGMAVFGFVLTRLRHRLRRERTDHASASLAKPHVQHADPIIENEYETVRRPLQRFIETGRGASEYEATIRATSLAEGALADHIADRVRRHRAPAEPQPLPLAWALASTGIISALFAIAAWVLLVRVIDVPPAYGVSAGALIVGLGIFTMQDAARTRDLPWQGLGFAVVGAVVAVIGIMRLFGDVPMPEWAVYVWPTAGVFMIAISAFLAWRAAQALDSGTRPLRGELPSVLLERATLSARKIATVCAWTILALVLGVPYILNWLVRRDFVPEDVPVQYGNVLAVVFWCFAAVGGAAIARFAGLSRARPHLIAREKAERGRRLALHTDIMRTLERI